MIFQESLLSVLDNSGAKRVLCIKVLGYKKKHSGSLLVTTVKRAIHKHVRKKKTIKKGEIHRVLLVSCRKGFVRKTGQSVGGFANMVIMLRRDNISLPFGNRVRGPIFREVRRSFSKIITMCPNMI